MIDPFLKLLREMGLTPKELADFKQKQADYRPQENNVLRMNNKALGSKTGTKSYTWKQLYEQSTNRAPNDVDIGDWTREEMEAVLNEQEQQQTDYEDYGMTSELKELVIETKQHYEVYSKEHRSNEEVLKSVQDKIERGVDTDLIVSVLNTFNDIWNIYFDQSTESFPRTVENKFYSEIAAAGRMLGYS